jgi:hypothetical protein
MTLVRKERAGVTHVGAGAIVPEINANGPVLSIVVDIPLRSEAIVPLRDLP